MPYMLVTLTTGATMGKAVKSDGEVNKSVNEMCDDGLDKYKQEDADKVLKDDSFLKQCDHSTLCRAFYEYDKAFKEKNWHLQKHIEIKAWQSDKYRAFSSGVKKGAPVPVVDGVKTDPLDRLLNRDKTACAVVGV